MTGNGIQLRIDQIMLELEDVENRINEIRTQAVPVSILPVIENVEKVLAKSKQESLGALTKSSTSLLNSQSTEVTKVMTEVKAKQKEQALIEKAKELEVAAEAMLKESDQKKKAEKMQTAMRSLSMAVSMIAGASSSTPSAASSVAAVTSALATAQSDELTAMADKMTKMDQLGMQINAGLQALMIAQKMLKKNPANPASALIPIVNKKTMTAKMTKKQYKNTAEVQKDIAQMKALQDGLSKQSDLNMKTYQALSKQHREVNALLHSMTKDMQANAQNVLSSR